ncbi:26S proteasome regulatory complex protein [Encephalitozoon hellem ATCC 50504]|uniref:26S proteasome regulatory subunit RPN2 n=1 Tax=Encephalitozoon hellem TaxID=27973 RepID=A0A9Q9C1V1_ENCHE|nr:26S proteasome regulatory complex protein [Encephalitozoon hellem ATCC 50504]AFM97798.1 26S proteasome regulatory complex protein [Encephalitozoon hellem ATCC 50504]UTX42569.1 26S proteasome regulatory subunit RPN2 [Encephalitozoon hellem]|eukprot:XP_003886779.1 26S proteasome regulatory complex protein [Encephalitozoon hellem ATCC 50504]
MQTIRILPNIKALLRDGKEAEAVDVINMHVDVIAPYIKDDLKHIKSDDPKTSLCLSKIYFVLGDYDKAIEYALRAGDLLVDDGSFYYTSIVYHMMDSVDMNSDSKVRDFVLRVIRAEEVDDSLIGYLFSIKAYELLKEALVQHMSGENDYRKLLDLLISLGEEEGCLKEIYGMFAEIGPRNKPFIFYVVDAYFYLEDIEKVKELIEKLIKEDILLCYEVAFYIEDNYSPEIDVSHEKVMFILNGEFKKKILGAFLLEKNLTSFKFLESIARTRTHYLGLANSLMNLGTSNDTFYRSNADIFGQSSEWAKFCEVSSIGMIHLFNSNPYEILKNYLPSEVSQKEGGALMALGLIKAGTFSEEDTEYLLYFLDTEDTLTPELAYGVCLGLGLINMGSANNEILSKLKELSKVDRTLLVEASVYGMGILGLNSWNVEILEDLKAIGCDTEFERVKRAVGVSLSLVLMFSEEMFYDEDTASNGEFKNYINELLSDKDSIMRAGGVLSLGSAFVGTGRLSVISSLLPYINDGDDDVKRAAVIAIGLVCCDDRDLLVGTLEPLSENHNFFVRAAVAIILGLFLSGTGDKVCTNILEALMYDSNNLVRQSACIGAGFITMQCNPELIPNYKRIIERLNKLIVDKKESGAVELGAVFGRGLSEAGGRNIIFSVRNMSGITSADRIAGAILFLHYWYWYPLISMVSLCALPTSIFCFNEDLEEENIEIPTSGRYDNLLIRLPDTKKARRFKQRPKEDKEVITESPSVLTSGSRCTIKQREECGLDSPAIFFVKKK